MLASQMLASPTLANQMLANPKLLSQMRTFALLLLFTAALAASSQPPQQPSPTSDPLPALRRSIDGGHAAEALPQLDVLAGEPGATASRASAIQTMRGQAFYTLGRLSEAEKAFALALTADPANREAGQMRGMTLFRLGRPADAIPFLEKAGAAARQSRADPSYVLALCYMDGRRYDDARHAFATLYEFPPDSAEAFLVTARMLLRRDFLPVAQEFAAKAIQIDARLPLAHQLLGEIALAGNHLDEAAHQFETERDRDPLAPGLYDRLGDTYIRTGNYPRAESALRKAIVLEPNATGPYILLGKALLKEGDAAGAVLYLERARQMDPGNFMTRSILGQAYRAEGRTAEASAETRAAVQIQAASEPRLESRQLESPRPESSRPESNKPESIKPNPPK